MGTFVDRVQSALTREWQTAGEIAERIGGDRGRVGHALSQLELYGLCSMDVVLNDRGRNVRIWRLCDE